MENEWMDLMSGFQVSLILFFTLAYLTRFPGLSILCTLNAISMRTLCTHFRSRDAIKFRSRKQIHLVHLS